VRTTRLATVVVGVEDPGLRCQRLGDLMGVVLHRQPRADVEELPDACLRHQIADGRGENLALRLDPGGDAGIGRLRRVAGLAVSCEVVLAAKPVVVDPGGMRHRRVVGGLLFG
jgi:hypothetical protein